MAVKCTACRPLVSFGRYVLVTAGPVFTEEMWRLACCALQDAFSATLKPVKVKCSEGTPFEQGPVVLALPGALAGCPLGPRLAPPSRQCHLKPCRGRESSSGVSTFVPDTVTLSDSRQSREPGTQAHPGAPSERLPSLPRTCWAASTAAPRASAVRAAR